MSTPSFAPSFGPKAQGAPKKTLAEMIKSGSSSGVSQKPAAKIGQPTPPVQRKEETTERIPETQASQEDGQSFVTKKGAKRFIRKEDAMTEEQLAVQSMKNIESVTNSPGIIRYSLMEMIGMRETFRDVPEAMKDMDLQSIEHTIGSEDNDKKNHSHKPYVLPSFILANNDKAKAFTHIPWSSDAPAIPRIVLKPTTPLIDTRVKELKSLVNQVSVETSQELTETIQRVIYSCLDDAKVLSEALQMLMHRCCEDEVTCGLLTALLSEFVSTVSDAESLKIRKCLLSVTQTQFNLLIQDKSNVWQDIREEEKRDEKHRLQQARNGMSVFIGNLYMRKLCPFDVVLRVILDLSAGYPTLEYHIEMLLVMLPIVCPTMELELSYRLTVDEICRTIAIWEREYLMSESVMAMVTEVRQLKENGWIRTMKSTGSSRKDWRGMNQGEDEWEEIGASSQRKMKNVHRYRRDVPSMKEEGVSSSSAPSSQSASTFTSSSTSSSGVNGSQDEAKKTSSEFFQTCKVFWNDYVADQLVEEAVSDWCNWKPEQHVYVIYSLIKTIVYKTEMEQRRVSGLLLELIHRKQLTTDTLKQGIRKILDDYSNIRAHDHNFLALYFRNMFLPLFLCDVLTIRDIIDGWKAVSDNDGYLPELVFELISSMRDVCEEKGRNALDSAQIHADELFKGSLTEIFVYRQLKKANMQLVNEIVKFT